MSLLNNPSGFSIFHHTANPATRVSQSLFFLAPHCCSSTLWLNMTRNALVTYSQLCTSIARWYLFFFFFYFFKDIKKKKKSGSPSEKRSHNVCIITVELIRSVKMIDFESALLLTVCFIVRSHKSSLCVQCSLQQKPNTAALWWTTAQMSWRWNIVCVCALKGFIVPVWILCIVSVTHSAC